jgi:hypothetical protein
MIEFILYFALPVLVAIVGVCGYYAIVEGNKGHRLAEDTRTQQHPAIKPIRDAEFYRVNGHWIFGVRSEGADLTGHAALGACQYAHCNRHSN